MKNGQDTEHFNGTASKSRKSWLWTAVFIAIAIFAFQFLFVSKDVQETIADGEAGVDGAEDSSASQELLDSPIPGVDVETVGDTDTDSNN